MRGAFFTPRTSIVPKGAMKVSDKQSDAVAYLFTNAQGKPCAMVFYGKQSKPVAHFRYRSDSEREKSVTDYFQRKRNHDRRVQEARAEQKNPTITKRFQVGRTYSTRSICDHETIYSFRIISRTARTITTTVHGKTVRRGIAVYNGVEQFKPFGDYSMAAVIDATDDRAA